VVLLKSREVNGRYRVEKFPRIEQPNTGQHPQPDLNSFYRSQVVWDAARVVKLTNKNVQ
jgi:hypothetical protein